MEQIRNRDEISLRPLLYIAGNRLSKILLRNFRYSEIKFITQLS